MEQYGGRPGTDYGRDWWAAVQALFDEAFPGLPDGIRSAAAVGAHWDQASTPFARFEAGRCVAHVGVISHPVCLGGRVVPIAGIHAVCTAEDRRRRGLARELLAEALAWADRTHGLAKLSTDAPPVYTGHGFREQPLVRFVASLEGRPTPTRALRCGSDPEDAALLARLLAERVPASEIFGSADDGWMVRINAALEGRLDEGWVYLEEHDAIVAFRAGPGGVKVQEVIAKQLPPGEAVIGALPENRPVYWSFAPDRFDPGATPVPARREQTGCFMVRGDWPVLGPFGLSHLWMH